MTRYEHILDNRSSAVVDYLRRRLAGAGALRLVSAYFSIYGYELLAEELARVGSVRFLFGDPTSVDDLDPGPKDPKSFELTERGLVPNHTLAQKYLARMCEEWVGSDAVAIRTVSRSNFLHGKMYLTERAGVVGSSNFTRNGLGGGRGANVEINLATEDSVMLRELRDWFDDLWRSERLTRDAKQQVLEALRRIGSDHSPELIYYKTLYELFRGDIEARLDGEQQMQDKHLYESQVWNALYEFQKDGAKSAISRLQRHNGCILADSVGLGKTYTALAVIKYYELRNERVLVLCPNKLRENWALYPAYMGRTHNPFEADRFGYSLLSHTDLSRDRGMSGGIDLEHFGWGAFDLVVIDESHNFRNVGGARYERLMDEVIRQGAKTKVLMLSATPVNTTLIDLRNQVYLMTEGRDDEFRESLGVGNIRNMLAVAQREFHRWESSLSADAPRDKAALLESLGPDFFRLLDGVSIARSRRHVELFYGQEMARIGRFPSHEPPVNEHPSTDLTGALSYKGLANRIDRFELSIYRPSDYLVDEARLQELKEERAQRNFNQQDRERFLIAMMRTNFLKRLESSAHSLALTLERTVGKIDDLLDRIARYQAGSQAPGGLGDAELPDDDEDDEDHFINRGRRPYHLRELDLPGWKADLLNDRSTLAAAWEQVRAVTPERDGKLRRIGQAVRDRAANPTLDQDGRPNRKMLVFTTFKDTAEYLYENLEGLCRQLGLHIAMVSGDATRTTLGPNSFNDILSNFAPNARGRRDGGGEIDLLIATDCISEGQNLQDCDTVLNYDVHWNPVRLIQRLGRIDRIGSRSRSVRMISYWPTEDMEAYLRLRNRVQARMALADLSATGGDDPFAALEEGVQMEMRFRDEQLLRLREEILDLDDLSDSVVMSDFTLDHFFAQLLRYLERNRDELEATPLGAYAVTEPALGAEPGVIFFLRQRNAGADSRQRNASPVHPYYAVYIHHDGTIRYGCATARHVLGVLEAASDGKERPNMALCDRFDGEIDYGRDMAHYDKLLTDVLAHVRQSHADTQRRRRRRSIGAGGSRDFILPRASESPQDSTDFELVTWLVILPIQSSHIREV